MKNLEDVLLSVLFRDSFIFNSGDWVGLRPPPLAGKRKCCALSFAALATPNQLLLRKRSGSRPQVSEPNKKDHTGLLYLAPATGLEPVTSKLTASCSTIELRRNIGEQLILYTLHLGLVNHSKDQRLIFPRFPFPSS